MDAELRAIQTDLSRLGYRCGRLDGLAGPKTGAALNAAGLQGQALDVIATALRARVDAEADHILRPSLQQLLELAPRFPRAWLSALHASLRFAHVLPHRLPAYLAQLGHESAGFATLEEYASGEAYEGRADLGNTQPGDGRRYKGRGPIQITGRSNYRRYGDLLGVDLEDNPEAAENPRIAFKIAALYWLDHNLNAAADAGDFEAITRRINGGLNGQADRVQRLEAAQALFKPGAAPSSAAAPPTPPSTPVRPAPTSPPAPSSTSATEAPPMATPRQDTPLKDWLSELFDQDRRKDRRARLRATWQEMADFLMGLHETLLDEIEQEQGDIGEALDHVIDAYYEVLVDQLVTEADRRLDWQRVGRADVRAWLEANDGPFIRRLFTVARSVAALKRQQPARSRLLTLLPGPVVRPRPAPRSPAIEQHSEGSVEEAPEDVIEADDLGAILEADATEQEPAPSGPSNRTAARRLRAMQQADHRATGRTAADLPGRAQ